MMSSQEPSTRCTDRMAEGILFDISHYMIEDGPGIRTNVFVKGCPLRCRWCSNAFGLERKRQLSYQSSKCTGCGACVRACPFGTIHITQGKAVQDFSHCTGCQEPGSQDSEQKDGQSSRKTGAAESKHGETFPCVSVCPAAARKVIGKKMSVDEVLDEVLQDQIFYRRGGGGMTVSGGEILMQPAFVIELLKKGETHYLSNAIETSGLGKWDDLKQMIDHCDVVFMDVKAMDPDLHKRLTGVDNTLIQENIRMAASYCKDAGKVFVLRLPLIPGMNDTAENLEQTALLAKELGVELNVLPYHNLGADRYERIGKAYELKDLKPRKKQELKQVQSFLESFGAQVSMGGYGVESYS